MGPGGVGGCLGGHGNSHTSGIIQGVVTFTVPFVPTSLEVDARVSSNMYTAQAAAAQNGPTCAAGSPNWCYSSPVYIANDLNSQPLAISPVYISFNELFNTLRRALFRFARIRSAAGPKPWPHVLTCIKSTRGA
jgi:hypothetical protein